MRVVFDLQAAQTPALEQRGQFLQQLAGELARRGTEVFVVLNGAMNPGVDTVRSELNEIVGRQNIRLWEPPVPSDAPDTGAAAQRRVAERLRQAVITELEPDLLVDSTLVGCRDEPIVTGAGFMTDWFPVLAMAPGPDDAGSLAAGDLASSRRSLERQLEPLRAAGGPDVLEVPGLTDLAAYVPDVEEARRTILPSTSVDEAAETITARLAAGERQKLADACKRKAAAGKPRLAFVSPLPPERTGIGYYSAELLPELAAYYSIDVVTDQDHVADAWVRENCEVLSVEAFRAAGHTYDRVIYQFGNSHFHAHMWDLIKRIPGIAVVHDFYLGDAVAYREDGCGKGLELPRELYAAHGYAGLGPILEDEDRAEAIRRFPASHTPFRESRATVVHSDHARELARSWYNEETAKKTDVIRHPRKVIEHDHQAGERARERLGLAAEDFIVVTFGLVNKNKLPGRLVNAWLASNLSDRPGARLIFVGEPSDEAARAAHRRVEQYGRSNQVTFTGWMHMEAFLAYQQAADVAVQLRTNSRGETSGTVLDCMASGLATICNAHGSFAELPDNAVRKLPDEFTDEALAAALDELAEDRELRESLGQRAREEIARNYHPQTSACDYHKVIEAAYAAPGAQRIEAIRCAARELQEGARGQELAGRISRALAGQAPQGQLLVDVSVVAREDLRTGVQRVVRSILGQLLAMDIPGYRVEPVYTHAQLEGFLYARDFTQHFLGGQESALPDEPIEVAAGDLFLGLDLHPDGITAKAGVLMDMWRQGVGIQFVVHDLLPVTHPQWFPAPEEHTFHRWLETITAFDGAICVSRTTADELHAWMERNGRLREAFRIGVAHNGADIENSAPTTGFPPDAGPVLERIGSVPSFLMVGTVEPRKGAEQALNAFELLWEQGIDVNLVLVGKQGWDIEDLAHRLQTHPENGYRLFWLRGVSDEYLEALYAASTCLLAASEAEGFGLPLIEAAQHKIPILARDITVFREVAGAHAEYFRADNESNFADEVASWLQKYRVGQDRESNSMPYKIWSEVVSEYIGLLLGRD